MSQMDYGFNAITSTPAGMNPWQIRIDNAAPSTYGQYVLVAIEPAGIELHHQVEVIDESGFPLAGVWVIFGTPGEGRDIGLPVTGEDLWPGRPYVLKGNPQRTPISGYVQHTYQSGGEDIWIWDLENGNLRYPSPIVRNCKWVTYPTGIFEHTGVKLTFQRRKVGEVPLHQRLAAIEASGGGGGADAATIADLQNRIRYLEQLVGIA